MFLIGSVASVAVIALTIRMLARGNNLAIRMVLIACVLAIVGAGIAALTAGRV